MLRSLNSGCSTNYTLDVTTDIIKATYNELNKKTAGTTFKISLSRIFIYMFFKKYQSASTKDCYNYLSGIFPVLSLTTVYNYRKDAQRFKISHD